MLEKIRSFQRSFLYFVLILRNPPLSSLNYFLQFYGPLRTLAHLKSLFYSPASPSSLYFLNLSIEICLSLFGTFGARSEAQRVRLSSLFSILHESSSQFQSSSSLRSLLPLPSRGLSIPIFLSLSLPLPSVPLSRRLVLVHADLAGSLLRTAFLRYGAIRRSRAAGGTEKRRP